MALQCAWCAFPAFVKVEWWKVYVAVPLMCGCTLAAVVVTLAAIRDSDTDGQEMRFLVGLAGVLALGVVARYWWWTPHRGIQAVMVIRQYVTLGAAVVGLVAWLYLRVSVPGRTSITGWWVLWLWSMSLLSSTGAGGLLWSMAQWKGNLGLQRWVNCGGLVWQVGLLLKVVWGVHWSGVFTRGSVRLDHRGYRLPG